MAVMAAGNVKSWSLWHDMKAALPMVLTVSGSSTSVKNRQRWKALTPMVVTELGTTTRVTLMHSAKALSAMAVTV